MFHYIHGIFVLVMFVSIFVGLALVLFYEPLRGNLLNTGIFYLPFAIR